MDLRLTKNGKIFYRVDPTLAAILIEALPSVFERSNEPAPVHSDNGVNTTIPNHPAPEWEIALDLAQKRYIQLLIGKTEYRYTGSPEGAVAHFTRMGFPPPQSIIDRWTRLHKATDDIHIPGVGECMVANRKTASNLEMARKNQIEAAADRDSQVVPVGTFGVETIELKPFLTRDPETGKYL